MAAGTGRIRHRGRTMRIVQSVLRLAAAGICVAFMSACTALVPPGPGDSPGYVADGSGQPVVSSDGECVRTGYWTSPEDPCPDAGLARLRMGQPPAKSETPVPLIPPPVSAMPTPVFPDESPLQPVPRGEGFKAPRVPLPDVARLLPEVKVYYATDRAPTGSKVAAAFYGERAQPALEFGIAYVTIPFPVHTRGEFNEPKWWKLEFRVDPAKHVYLRHVSPFANGNQFQARLRQDVAARKSKEIFVFVHGFNVKFDEAARRTAQIAYDLDLDIVPVLFSWTSQGKLLKYWTDEDMSDQVVNKLYPFLQNLAEQSGAQSIHLVAHSLGNRFLARALKMLDVAKAFEQRPLFNQLVMAAPDIKLDAFNEVFAPVIRKAGCRTTLYFSKQDKALWGSAFNHDNRRLGANSPLVATQGWLDAIDASAVDMHLLGINHSYYGTRQVVEDIKQVLRRVATPRRSLVPSRGAASGDYWKFQVNNRKMPAIDKSNATRTVPCR